MLTKLDEFGGLVDTIRSDTSLCVDKTVLQIQTKCEDMKQIFKRIDQLEKFVQIVRESVTNMEECVNKAENDMGSFNFKKIFSSLVSSKKSIPGKEERPVFNPPEIFVTEEYLNPVSNVAQTQPTEDTEQTEQSQNVPNVQTADA